MSLTYRSRAGGEVVTGVGVRKVPVDRVLRDHLAQCLPRAKSRSLVRRATDVPRIYTLAYACHVPPPQAVAAAGISQGAAEQRVLQAREKGLLPPTEMGRAKA